jgi:O-antigen ligase
LHRRREGWILLAVLAALASGLVGLVYPTPYSPLLVGALIAGAAITAVLFWKPVWASYAAVFVVLLPIGLIPPEIHSLLNRTAAMVALGTWVFDVIVRRQRVTWTISSLLMLAFLGWSGLTLAWTGSVGESLTILQAYALRFILFLLLLPNLIRTEARLDGLMNTLALNGWILAIVSVVTVLTAGYSPGSRLQVLLVNANSLGILVLLTMQGVLWQVIKPGATPSRLKRLLTLVFVGLAVALTSATGSRGSAASLVVVLLALGTWKPSRRWGRVGLLIIALGLVLVPFVFSTTFERFAIESGDTFLGGREALWQAASTLILEHPLRGVGIGNAPRAVTPYVLPLRSVGEHESVHVHNPILTIWIETGLPGLLLYLGVLGGALWLFLRAYLGARKQDVNHLAPYFALVSATFLGYMISWIKGGGTESDFSYFLMLALLIIPSCVGQVAKEDTAANALATTWDRSGWKD